MLIIIIIILQNNKTHGSRHGQYNRQASRQNCRKKQSGGRYILNADSTKTHSSSVTFLAILPAEYDLNYVHIQFLLAPTYWNEHDVFFSSVFLSFRNYPDPNITVNNKANEYLSSIFIPMIPQHNYGTR